MHRAFWVGAIRYWEVVIGDDPALLLGPVAVHPTRQGEGLGGLLMNEKPYTGRGRWMDTCAACWGLPYYRNFLDFQS